MVATLSGEHAVSKKRGLHALNRDKLYASAAMCMDGAIHRRVVDKMQQLYGVDYVDKILAPGINRLLAETSLCSYKRKLDSYLNGRNLEKLARINRINDMREYLAASMRLHASGVMALVGHEGCGGNPASKDEQIAQLRKARKNVQRYFGLKIAVILLWVPSNENQKVEVISNESN